MLKRLQCAQAWQNRHMPVTHDNNHDYHFPSKNVGQHKFCPLEAALHCKILHHQYNFLPPLNYHKLVVIHVAVRFILEHLGSHSKKNLLCRQNYDIQDRHQDLDGKS